MLSHDKIIIFLLLYSVIDFACRNVYYKVEKRNFTYSLSFKQYQKAVLEWTVG